MRRVGLALACGVAIAIALGAFEACGGSPTTESTSADAGTDAIGLGEGGEDVVSTEAGSGDRDGGLDANRGDADGGGVEDASADTPTIDANGPPFGCGTGSLVCYEATEFCSQVTGPHGGVFYDCIAAPSACAADVSCACLAAQSIEGTCTEGDGGITVAVTEP